MLAADACYFCQTLRERRLPRNMHDREAMLASLDRLEALERGGARIFFSHDPEFWQTVPLAPTPIAASESSPMNWAAAYESPHLLGSKAAITLLARRAGAAYDVNPHRSARGYDSFHCSSNSDQTSNKPVECSSSSATASAMALPNM